MTIPLRVLIAEDSEDDALLLVRELRRGGFEPAFHRVDTPEALRLALALHEWDIVFADYSMPHFSSTAALSVVREHDLDLPFIIVSGTMGEDRAVEAMKAGAQDYVIKGSLKRLLPAVERELHDARERREREGTEERLRATEQRLHQVMASSTAVLYTTAFAGSHRNGVSENITRILGYDVDESLAPTWWLDRLHPEDRDAVVAAIPSIFAQEHLTVEYRFRHQDGSYRWIHDEARLVRDATGRPTEILGTWVDVTERKTLEAQLRQAQKTMEAVGRLAAGIAHDFSNLLPAIVGSTEFLLTALGPAHPGREDAREVLRVAMRAADLTRHLLAFSREQVLNVRS